MLALVSWIPVIGSVLNGISNYFTGRQELEATKDSNDVETIRARSELLAQLKDDTGIKVARDFAMWGPIAYVSVYIWDRIMDIPHPELVWGVRPLDLPWDTYLPIMAVYAFLFGLAWRGK